ncbi:MAG: hypothetical protein HY690_02225 [Chloroflexi bacterium]|nr:hypothetical protein [Chloroflexota bacterium]
MRLPPIVGAALHHGPGGAAGRVYRWLGAILVGGALGLILRVLLFFLGTLALDVVAALVGAIVSLLPAIDPVYTRAALHSLAEVDVQGVAIAGPVGDALHALAPRVVLEPAWSAGSLVRLVVEPDSAVLGRLVAAGFAHAGVLAVGLWLVGAGLAQRRPRLTLAGLAAQVQVALSVLGAPPSLDDLEAAGMSFALNALLPGLVGRRVALSDLVADVAPTTLEAGLVALALLSAYLLAAGATVLAGLLGRRAAGGALAGWYPVGAAAVRRRTAAACAGLACGLVLASAAIAGFSQPTTVAPSQPEDAAPPAASSWNPERDDWFEDLHGLRVAAPAPPPSRVEVQGNRYRYRYLVNGQPQVIRGMGLNTQYRQVLAPGERAARLDADFAAMQRLGVNTVLGWDPLEFDETLLDLAARHGLGVVPPFDLDPSADYTDPSLRADLTRRVLAWVARYRDHPALRMWGLGNEVLHKIVHPVWVGPQDPARDRNADAFAAWLLDAAEAIHAADPDHPVTYRDAEDAFTSWVADELHRRGGSPRPWFVWGANCYSDYLAEVVDRWREKGLNVPLWVSEFAPGGMAPGSRTEGFRQMWGYVRRHPEWVLGGAVYAWTRNGPEEIDRTLGLTDDGTPLDRHVLRTLALLFHGQP